MINILVEKMRPCIEALSWVDKFGGLARPVTKEFETQTGVVKKTFPVACNTAFDCIDTGDYMDLLPNDNYKSVVYFEEISGLTQTDAVRLRSKKGAFSYSLDIRLVAWLNLAKLGVADCVGSDAIAPTLLKSCLNCDFGDFDQDGFRVINFKTTFRRQLQRRLNVIFQGYTYEDRQDIGLYPFDYFAMEFTITFETFKDCIPDFTPGAEIPCP